MTPQEAKTKFKAIITEEINRFPSHYDAEIDDNVYSDTSRVNEILELNKVVCEALEKQAPKKPKHIGKIDENGNAEVECDCFASQDVAIKTIKRVYCWKCGQLLDWEGEDGI